MTTYTKIAAKGVVIIFCVSILSSFLAYLIRLILVKDLTVEEFGLFYSVLAFLGLISIFKSLGFDRALVKFIPEFVQKKNLLQIKRSLVYVIGIHLFTNAIVIAVIYLLSSFLSTAFFKSPQADLVLKMMAIAFFIDSFVAILKASFQGFQKMGLFAGIDLIRMILVLGFILIGVTLNWGIRGPLIAYTIVPILLLLGFGWILTRNVFKEFFSLRYSFDGGLFKKISTYAIFIITAGAANLIIGYTDTLALTYFKGLTDVALYNIALPTAKLMLYFPFAIGYVLFPLTAELWAKKEKNLLKQGMDLLYKYAVMIIVPLSFVMYAFSDTIIHILFGAEYLPASRTLQILSIGMIFAAIYNTTANFFMGIDKPKIYSNLTYVAAAINLIGNILLVPSMGIEGAAISTAVTYLIITMVGLQQMKKFIAIGYPLLDWGKVACAGAVFLIIMVQLKEMMTWGQWPELILIPMVSILFYSGMLFALKAVRIAEIKDIIKRVIK